MHNFKGLKIWQESVKLAKEIFILTRNFPDSERFVLISQMNRSGISVASNIAEGSSRSNKEFKKYLGIALGSCFELETQLIIANDFGYISKEKFDTLSDKCSKVQSMIVNFKKTLKT